MLPIHNLLPTGPFNSKQEALVRPSYSYAETKGYGRLGGLASSLLGGSQGQPEPMSGIIDAVVKKYPGLSRVVNSKNAVVSVADKNRIEALKNIGGAGRSIETWFPDDPGDPRFPNPNMGKYTFEFYDNNLAGDRAAAENAVFLDSIHIAKKDPEFKKIRDEFNNNWSNSELNFLKSKYAKEKKDDKETFSEYMDRTAIDAYLRGGLNPATDEELLSGKYNDEYALMYRDKYSENGKVVNPYTKKQKDAIEKMRQYLKGGKK